MATPPRESAPELVRLSVRDRVATLVLCNPPANCYSHEMMTQLDARIVALRFEKDVDVIVLRGEGSRFFCAGADIAMLREADPHFKNAFCLHANETLLRLEHTPKLVIAALNGHCVGGGLEVALACDLRVACRGAGQIGLPEVALGVLPGTGGTQRLVRLLGKSKAIELMATGAKFDAERARELGLVNEILDADGFDERLHEYARRFTAPSAAPMAIGLLKRACQSGAEMSLEQGLGLERELQARLFASADAKEGLAAFLEKRGARFEGR